ncbi:extracellular solute-binding protein [uncultured Anaerococcus sp.]|uniref:extracellular solute-binding protein n=1 Tax=uncultured Anaerococcus sp. TaxID=293428 RepID=UPI0025CF1CC3|nr:extracellular solute-binding protein [uncultured Anaerococcus sp.]
MKKKLSLLMALVLSLGVFSACGNDAGNTEGETKEETKLEETENKEEAKEEEPAKEGQTEVVFWHAMGGGQGEALEGLVKDFEEENSDVKITLQHQGGYGDLNQILVATMQSPKDLPTITQAYPDWMLQFSEAGMVTDLTEKVNGEDGIEDYEDIFPGVRDEIEQDGKIIGIPFNKSTEVLWYNQDLFDELELENPTNFEELKEAAKKIKEEKDIPAFGWDSLSNFYVAYLKNKGIEFGPDLDVTSPESIEAVNYYLDGIKEGYFRIAGTDQYLSGPFANEQLAGYIGSNAGEVYVKEGVEGKFKYAAQAYPAAEAVQQGTNIYMFDGASDEEKDAAFRFLKYVSGKDAQIKFGLETGYMPARKTAVEDEDYKNAESEIPKILDQASEKLFSRPLVPGSQQAYNDVASKLEEILSNPDSDVEAEMEAFKAQFESDFEN